MNYIAHVKKNEQETAWEKAQTLEEHLIGTAKLAKEFASKFGFPDLGEIIGILHDAGKATEEWQEYIRVKTGFNENNLNDIGSENNKIITKHAIYGVKISKEKYKILSSFLSYCIAGHHSGLDDYFDLEYKIQETNKPEKNYKIKEEIINKFLPNMPDVKQLSKVVQINPNPDKPNISTSLFIRMLFSCLVDADFLDTESYMTPSKNEQRSNFTSLHELKEKFDQYMLIKEEQSENTSVNKLRHSIANDCIKASQEKHGIFSLTVPTGGGKTLASMAFALNHAIKHKLERIIYVIPYTSIIEQTADNFRKIFGDDNVVEHHSNINKEKLNIEEDTQEKLRLATENWDAPIIVTTSVQFFESLFSCKPSRCRKLHNITKSVVVLDEAQLIPIEYQNPILKAIQCLSEKYFTTFVISTATQPVWTMNTYDIKGFPENSVREIIHDVADLYSKLKRVEVETRKEISSLEEISEELMNYEQVLCIVSDRKTCRELYKLMPKETTIHLSAMMCGQHRSDVIETIKRKLINKENIRVISTQLVEAGVDIDFPVVYRAMAGLDSIAQSAGRCNREGLLERGKVIVFNLEKKPPQGILQKAWQSASELLSTIKNNEILLPDNFTEFFKLLYYKTDLDKYKILKLLNPDSKTIGIKFKTASENFKIIDDSMSHSIIVRYKKSNQLLEEIKYNNDRILTKTYMRKLQRYTVNIYNNDFEILKSRKSIYEIWKNSDIWALSTDLEYKEDVGLIINDNDISDFTNPEVFII